MTTWSATDRGTGLTVSGSTVTCTATADTMGRATTSFSSGNIYYEASWNVDAFSGQSIIIGFANSAAATNAVLGNAANTNQAIGVRSGGIVYDARAQHDHCRPHY